MAVNREVLKATLAFIYSCVFFHFFSQTRVYPIGNKSIPIEIKPYFSTDSLLDLTHLRGVTDFLTNPSIKEENGIQLTARKKAVIRYVKEISEELELDFLLHKKMNDRIIDLVYELEWMRLSYFQKALSNSVYKLSFDDKVDFFLNTLNSKRKLRISIPEHEAVTSRELATTPFYSMGSDSILPQDRFDLEAKEKKIKARSHMVVLADQCSFGGSTAKFDVLDTDLDNKWVLKWGDEIHTDIFCSRLFSALGYHVDFPFYYSYNLTLVFDENGTINSPDQLIDSLKIHYGINIEPYIKNKGIVTGQLAEVQRSLLPFVGKQYMNFIECSLEARPDRVKRLGSFMPYALDNSSRRELRASLLAQAFINNWDTKEDNTVLTIVNQGNKRYKIEAVFSDLGTSMGVHISWLRQDFKVGLVNELPWEVVKRKHGKLHFTSSMNGMVDFYENTSYEDIYWLAQKLAFIDSTCLRKMIEAAHWPPAISELYFHKMASRRASILKALNILDPHPIGYSPKLNLIEDGRYLIKNGKLCKSADLKDYPVSYMSFKGRRRNYGNKN